MKYYKVEALLKLKGMNLGDFSNHLGVARQQITNKKKADAFKADDLIRLAELTNTTLAFIDHNNKVLISFDTDDLSKTDN